jgi:DNA-binding response OmpR family regulator
MPDLTILDVMMPVLDGHDVCHVLRSEGDTPIIFLTARAAEDDLVSGLSLGADDYITKPFSPRELVARVEAVLRRVRPTDEPAELQAGSLVLDEARHTVALAGRPVDCTPAEFRILRELVARPHHVFSRSRLLEAAFGFDHDALERTIDAHVMNLRRKLEPDPRHPRHLTTVYGIGYKFVPDPEGDRDSTASGAQ